MGAHARILVIGPRSIGERVAQALPQCDVTVADAPLEGVWQAGRHEFDRVLVSLASGGRVMRAVETVRQITPEARVVVACEPAEEPQARQALTLGADDYVLEPLRAHDLERALRLERSAALPALAESAGVSADEIVRFGEILQHLEEGVTATMERLASLLRNALAATGVVVECDGQRIALGDVDDLTLEAPLVRDGAPVGRIALGRRSDAAATPEALGDETGASAFPAATAVRLTQYAALALAAIDGARRHERLVELASTDELSGLRNRRYLCQRLDELLAEATRRRQRLTVLLFDIDDFKSYNDRFGHETGDALLREMGVLLTRCTREHDVVSRFGGDEFVVVFTESEQARVPGSHPISDPEALVDRFHQAVCGHEFHCLGDRAPGPLTISGGLAAFPWDGATREALLRAADAALLEAKRVGKNRIQLAWGLRNGGGAIF